MSSSQRCEGKWFLGIAPRVQHEVFMEQGTMSVPNGGIRGHPHWVVSVLVSHCSWLAVKSAPPAFFGDSQSSPNSFLKLLLVEIVRVDFCCSQSGTLVEMAIDNQMKTAKNLHDRR